MKIAVCISGHLRDGDKTCFLSLKKYLLDIYDCDIFISSWDINYSSKNIHNNFHSKYEVSENIDPVSERIISTYKPIKFIIENGKPDWLIQLEGHWGDKKLKGSAHVSPVLSMFKKIEDADLLRREHEKTHSMKYDIVMRIRFDLELICDVIEKTKEDLNKNSIIVKKQQGGLVDVLFFGTSENMSLACSCYSMNPITFDNHSQIDNGEHVLQTHFDENKISKIFRNDIHFKSHFRGNEPIYWGDSV